LALTPRSAIVFNSREFTEIAFLSSLLIEACTHFCCILVVLATPTFTQSSSLSKLVSKLNTKPPATFSSNPIVSSTSIPPQPIQPQIPPQPPTQPSGPSPIARVTIKPSQLTQEQRNLFNKSSSLLSTTSTLWQVPQTPLGGSSLLDTTNLLPTATTTTNTTTTSHHPISVSTFLQNSQQFNVAPQLSSSTLTTSPPRVGQPSFSSSSVAVPVSSSQFLSFPTLSTSSNLLHLPPTTSNLASSNLFKSDNPSFLAPSQSITFDTNPTLSATSLVLPPTQTSSVFTNPLSQPLQNLPPPPPTPQQSQPQPSNEERLIGSFGTELESVSIGTARPGDVVLLERDLNQPIPPDSFRVLVKTLTHLPIGFLPSRISTWLSHILISGRVRILAKIPKYKTDKVLVVIDLFGPKLTAEDWRAISLSEKGAWHQLAGALGIPVQDIVPARVLTSRLDLDAVVAHHNARSVASHSNLHSQHRSAGSSGGLKRPADDSVEPADRSKRTKFNTSSPVQPGLGNGINNSVVFAPPLAVSSPSVRGNFNGSSSTGVVAGEPSAATEQSYIERLFKSLRSQMPEVCIFSLHTHTHTHTHTYTHTYTHIHTHTQNQNQKIFEFLDFC